MQRNCKYVSAKGIHSSYIDHTQYSRNDRNVVLKLYVIYSRLIYVSVAFFIPIFLTSEAVDGKARMNILDGIRYLLFIVLDRN